MTTPPNDHEIMAALAAAFDRPIVGLTRAPHPYATSHALEEIHVRFAGGDAVELVFKDLDRRRLLPAAASGKPAFLYEPRRELETYRSVLSGTGIGPRCHAAISDERRQWLFLDKLPGIELWQVGRLEVWEAVAAWLALFHDTFGRRRDTLMALNPHLLDRDGDDFDRWRARSCVALADADDPRAAGLARRLGAMTSADLPRFGRRTFLHGELYPSNVLVAGDDAGASIWPIDWEMAAVGPAGFDLAALVTGWDDAVRARMVDRYRHGLEDPPGARFLDEEIDACRLHLGCQWLGWSAGWQAPAEHAHDWIGEVLDAGARLGW